MTIYSTSAQPKAFYPGWLLLCFEIESIVVDETEELTAVGFLRIQNVLDKLPQFKVSWRLKCRVNRGELTDWIIVVPNIGSLRARTAAERLVKETLVTYLKAHPESMKVLHKPKVNPVRPEVKISTDFPVDWVSRQRGKDYLLCPRYACPG